MAKWSADTKKFFSKAQDHSLVLEVIISLSCKSQTGDSFEELINAINSEEILRKVKKVNILDTTYLYRHFYSDFSKYSDISIATPWYLENKSAIKKLKAKVELKSWANEINTKDFKDSYKQIMKEYAGDSNRKGIIFDFRDTVTSEAAINAYKHKKDFQQCVDFILEECAHLHSAFRHSGANIVYPMKLYSAGDYMIRRHSLNINHLSYRTSKDIDNGKEKENQNDGIDDFLATNYNLSKSDIEAAVTNFMKSEVTNMNFFVVDKKGKLIYSNFSLERLVNKELTAAKIDKDAWIHTLEVIRSGEMFVGEEKARDGRIYLSMKAPLRINGAIEGAIGLSIDITDTKRVEIEKKRASDLEFLNRIQQIKIKFQNKFTQFISQMAHDITSPLVSLEVFAKTCKNLPSEQQYVLSGITSSIRNIADDLLQKYKYNKRELDFSKKQNVLVSLALSEVINQKKLQYNNKREIRINLSYDSSAKYSFINIDQSNFLRTISNLINNAVEACKEKHGIINVKLKVENNKAVIEVSDNGKGMSEKMINQIMSDIPVESTKQNGCGLGLCQVMETARLYHGEINIVSRGEKGTKFIIAFPLIEQPEWISKQINLHKNNIVMVLDNEAQILPKEWKKTLKDHIKHSNLHFFKDSQTVNDFIDSLSREERENVFVLMSYNPMDSVSEDILNSVLQGGLMKQSVIMTNAYNDKRLQEFVAMAGGKMVPAQFLEDIKIAIEKQN